ncbi:MAG TPA: hypothetical protein VMT80_02595 [Candidatus Paceibacterota bacterium]|nr:hypothetical protein [Candidatus Paceibacterota bacterium]
MATARRHATGKKPVIGFIGQGWIGKNYADDFERRGYRTVRYSLEEPYRANKDRINECDVVFIAVPTPTTPKGFDASIVADALALVGRGKIAVIKSTLLPGTANRLQRQFPRIIVTFSPEFLTEATAAHDAAHPTRNIVGIPARTPRHRRAARRVLALLPEAPFSLVCTATEAELIKYGANNWFYFKVIFINLLYDLAEREGATYDVIREGLAADPRVGKSHLMPVHKSGTLGSDNFRLAARKPAQGKRGAGGHCFIKDFAAFRGLYETLVPEDREGRAVLRALEAKNARLLIDSGKDLELLVGVYGPGILRGRRARTGKRNKVR